MTPPTVRINTFVKEYEKTHVDIISKILIVLQTIFGLNGMPLIGKKKGVYISLSVAILLNGIVICVTIIDSYRTRVTLMMIITIIRNIITTVLSYWRYKWIERFYKKLNKFDEIAGCRPKLSKLTALNMVLASLICIFLFVVTIYLKVLSKRIYLMQFHILYSLEMFYFSHLLTLLPPRIKLINYYNESSLAISTFALNSFRKEFVYLKCYDANIDQCQIRRLMELYQTLVEAFDFYVEGVKWQLLLAIISSFAKMLGFLYVITLSAVWNVMVTSDIASREHMGIAAVLTLPLFVSCILSGYLHNEVKNLRALLASRLYEKKLDKPDRRTARAFLAITETRDLSFRLLRMLNIDISLPFKFIGLLVTYLIILLQFNKVINL